MKERPDLTSAETALRWLARPEVIRSLGAAAANDLRRRYQRIINQAQAEGCSSARIDSAVTGGEPVRVQGMKLARGRVRYGEGTPSRRWTPSIAATTEDRYDQMSVIEATLCNDPSSVTGIQLERIRERCQRTKAAPEIYRRQLAGKLRWR